MEHALLKQVGPERMKFVRGVTAMAITGNGDLLIGAGDGTVAHMKPNTWKIAKKITLQGTITSISPRGEGHEFFVGTSQSNMYRVSLADFDYEHILGCHPAAINDVQFSRESSELYGTCAGSEIRIWHTYTNRELLRIDVPNKVCNAFLILPSGHAIVSGWDDGALRGFLPESGRLAFEVPNANSKGVTAIATTQDCSRLVTGGGDGQVRVWKVGSTVKLHATLKEHKGRITSIMINSTDQEAISSSVDGSCIVWDLQKLVRSQIIMANTLFTQVSYRPDEAQVLTVGTDRKVGYWEMFNGALIRDLEVSETQVNTIAIAQDGNRFVVGGNDKVVKVFSYKEGNKLFSGNGHSASITRVAIDPAQELIVSVSVDGGILLWEYPN
eukprot:m.240211 g.240211  ORF g.240211 m.240211 type:complete len:384 (+) comp16075_c0_seq3:1031-2182(+)